LKNVRVGIVCLDPTGRIIGGSSAYPDLVPPAGQVLIKADSIIVSGRPATCEMRADPGT
jgi:hypothetical protein